MIRDLKEERLRVIDELLSGKTVIPNIYTLQRLVNNRLKDFRAANSESLFRNLLTDLRALLPKDVLIIDPRKNYKNRWKDGYCYSEPGYSYFKEEKTREEEAEELLSFAAELISVFKDSPVMDEFRELVEQLLEDNHAVGDFDRRIIQMESGVRNTGTRWVKPIYQAIRRKQAFKMRYEKLGGEEKTKNVCPYLLKEYRNRWYMVAYDHDSDRSYKTNVFALNCINDIQPGTKSYFKDPGFDADNYFKYSLGIWHSHTGKPIKVQLEFNDKIIMEGVRWTPLHHSQRIIPGNKNRLTIELEVYDTPELEMLIKSYGSAVKVLGPEVLAKRIKMEAQKIIQHYQ